MKQQTDAQLIGQGMAFPPRIDAEGRIAWSSGAGLVRESIRIILSTERRERLMLPEFGGGLRGFLFDPNTPATHRLIEERIRLAVGRWEPRVQLQSVKVSADPEDSRGAIAVLHYRLLANGAEERLDIGLQLGGQE